MCLHVTCINQCIIGNISIKQEVDEMIQSVPHANEVRENTEQPTNEGIIHIYLLFSLFKTIF